MVKQIERIKPRKNRKKKKRKKQWQTEMRQMGRNLPKYEGEHTWSHGSAWRKNQELKTKTKKG